MIKRFFFLSLLLVLFTSAFSQVPQQENALSNISSGTIKVYFNHPVDVTVATGMHAGYLHNAFDDTLIAYISRAKYTIDIAVYNYFQSSTQIASISSAINTAFANGRKIRWIYDGSSSNSGLSQLNSSIPTLASPVSSDYGIMHNKFMIIDAGSANDSDAIVWTGSTNWNAGQMNDDVNNVIILQDKDLAVAYTTEFNEMWGDTGMVPDMGHSRFGQFKTDNTQHIFNIGGRVVECYFSPSDNTNDHISNVLSSANSDISFGVYTFTMSEDADSIKYKIQQEGVYACGIIDQYSQGFNPYSILHPVMGNQLKVYAGSSSIYHNKLVIVDACDYSSDPVVETGSHNWTVSANTINDENALVIHDSTITNLFYQSFRADFSNLGGMQSNCFTIGIAEPENDDALNIFPNPSAEEIALSGMNGRYNSFSLLDVTGCVIRSEVFSMDDILQLNVSGMQNGIYFILLEGPRAVSRRKFTVLH
jgi:hypothetical protein